MDDEQNAITCMTVGKYSPLSQVPVFADGADFIFVSFHVDIQLSFSEWMSLEHLFSWLTFLTREDDNC